MFVNGIVNGMVKVSSIRHNAVKITQDSSIWKFLNASCTFYFVNLMKWRDMFDNST